MAMTQALVSQELSVGSRLLCETAEFVVFERRFYSDDPLQAQEFAGEQKWAEIVLSLRPPDTEHLICPRTLHSEVRYLHHHLVVRMAPEYLRALLAPDSERVLETLQPFVRGESPLPQSLYLLTSHPLLAGVVESLRMPPRVGSLRLFYEAKIRELVAYLCFREPGTVPAHYDTRLSEALAYLQAHMSDPDALRKVFAQLPMSQRHCQRLFRVALGCSPSEYLTELRMRKAVQLLTTTNRSISAIALEVGYLNLSHFSSVFRQRFGVSPREFRRAPQQAGVLSDS